MQKSCIAILLSIFISSCAFSTTTVLTNYQITRQEAVHEQIEQGECSWYGPGFHGRRTASHERFNQNALTAAHPTLPFGTEVELTNTRNGRTVQVRINDRGPFVRGRICDLSKAAANAIGMVKSGVAKVQIRVINKKA